MLLRLQQQISAVRYALTLLLTGPQALAFLPALILGGFWLGGEPVLLLLALGLPALMAIVARKAGPAGAAPNEVSLDDAYDRESLEATLDRVLSVARRHLRRTACILVEIDDFDTLLGRHGQSAADTVGLRTAERLGSVLRGRDSLIMLGEGQFGIALAPVRRLNSEVVLQMAERLQGIVEEPMSLDRTTIYVSASVGLCLDSFVPHGDGRDLADAAGAALVEARRHAPSAIRAYTPELGKIASTPQQIDTDLVKALDNGQIRAWFQPQLSTDTGQISGFEALVRWIHPNRGLISPAEFLPPLQDAGKMGVLGQIVLRDAFTAMKAWRGMGFDIPHVGVNFSAEELRDPKLLERIQWELDRYGLTPGHLAVEILESVVASSPEDTVTRNIRGLGDLGCYIDLDDFGTGHASISSIRRFAVQRLKIDRSFVMKVDCDVEQQRMVNAILLMAEQLGLEALAEGVETAGEHAMLAQLGCGHVQGFGVGRPMPFEDTGEWIAAHLAKLDPPPEIGRKTG